MGYDQLFKTILERLLRDFLELFFPEAAVRLDFQTLRFVDKEDFANVPEGEVREADVVARLETRDGEPELVPLGSNFRLASRAGDSSSIRDRRRPRASSRFCDSRLASRSSHRARGRRGVPRCSFPLRA